MNRDAYATVAQQHSLGRLVDVQRVKWANDIDRLVTSGGAFYCKTYTKPWYTSPEENAFPVRHEAGAYAALKAHGLATPDVVVAELGSANPLGRPFLLLRELEGTTIKQACSMGLDIAPLLRAAGRYLGRMHSIVFRYPGYVCSEHGPSEEPSPHGWRHTHWASEVLVAAAKDRWNEAGFPHGCTMVCSPSSKPTGKRSTQTIVPPECSMGTATSISSSSMALTSPESSIWKWRLLVHQLRTW